MLLRKELGGLHLEGVEGVAGERALSLRFRGRGAASIITRGLVLFFYGAGARAVLVDEDDAALGVLGARPVTGGTKATLPPPRSLPAQLPSRFGDSPEGFSERVAAYYQGHAAQALESGARERALSLVRRREKRLARLLDNLEADGKRAGASHDLTRDADLLLAHLADVPRGAAEVSLPDDFEEHAPPRRIALDPRRTAQENAARLYHTARRHRRGLKTLEVRIAATTEELAQVRQRLQLIAEADAEALPGLTREADETPTRSSMKPASSTHTRSARASEPYRRFRSSSGAEILVGKGAERNDELTFHVARGNDLWLHTRDLPGAHVVVPLSGRPIEESTLLDAATLAVWFSPARPASALDDQAIRQVQTDVTYVLRKLVRKPKGAGPGRVSVAGGKTIRVRLEPERLRRLLDSRAAD